MTPIRRILVPLDSGAASLRAIAPARHLADRFGVELELISWSFSALQTPWSRRRIERHLQRHAIDRPVELITTGARNAGIAVAEEAAERGAVVVMASHARGGPRRTILGSIAEEVLSHAPDPVVLVGPRVRLWEPSGRLVVGLDQSACSERALAPMAEWARDLGLPLELAAVTPGAPGGTYLDTVAASLPRDLTVRVAALHGDPASALADHSSRTDLLAVGSHSRRGIGRAVLGSVAMRLVHEARCPVVVVGAAARVELEDEITR
jgi:nucleotide-binding universal stress UspA family protein